jgi:hypothetical protein
MSFPSSRAADHGTAADGKDGQQAPQVRRSPLDGISDGQNNNSEGLSTW